MGDVLALVGAQWGSEGKGVIAAALAQGQTFVSSVRVGGPNAGHSFWYQGTLYKMRSIPCAWVNPYTRLVVGAGGVINPSVLEAELAKLPTRVEVVVDQRAVLIDVAMEHAEAGIATSIGSTGEGVGQARIARIKRDGSAVLAGDYVWHDDRIDVVEDTAALLNVSLTTGDVLLEGTQGSGLSLFHGAYPYVTSSDTNASGMASEAGFAPSAVRHVHLVARTFPIRVGGNSGPMGTEIGWGDLPVDEPERTTVTNKVRRVAQWSDDVFDRAIMLNRPCGLWLTFGDYIDPEVRGQTKIDGGPVRAMIERLEERHRVPVLGVGTGGPGFNIARVYSRCDHGTKWLTESDHGAA